MVTASDVLDSLYSNFVLRDFLSLVTPGAIILGTLLLCQFGFDGTIHILEQIPFVVYFPLFGICYILGVGMWTIGELLSKALLNGNFTIYDYDTRDNERKYYTNLKRMYEKLSGNENRQVIIKIRERFVLLMQTCGNCCIALFISVIILVICELSGQSRNSGYFIQFVVGMILVFLVCYFGYVIHRKYLKLWDQIVSKD